MGSDRIETFRSERERLNALVMRHAGLNAKRFHGLDEAVYRSGALPAKTKELLGLATSIVLRCDDCITYHGIRCHEEGVTEAELEETVAIALLVGGSITIPHIRRLWDAWERLRPPAGDPQTGG